jgi:hypothetical protein
VVGVVHQFEVLVGKLSDIVDLIIQFQIRERVRVACELFFKRLYVVAVNVSITHGVDEFTSFEAADLSQHAGEESITCNVEWHA